MNTQIWFCIAQLDNNWPVTERQVEFMKTSSDDLMGLIQITPK